MNKKPLAKPYGNRLLVKPLQKKKIKLKSGLEIDETDLQKGQIVDAPDKVDLKAGDVVYYPEKPPVGHTHEGELLQWLSIDDVHGFLTQEEHEQLEKEDGRTI
jgi:hypothetical protein